MDQMQRLSAAREKADEIEKKKIRLESELELHKESLEKLEKRCKEEFDCDVDALPDLIEEIEADIEKSIEKAEGMLLK